MKTKTTHLKEIAAELNLSVNTVSRALRDCYDISPKTKELVRAKAIELKYMPNTLSQYIKGSDKYLVAIIVRTLANQYVNYILEALIKRLKDLNMQTTIIFSDNDFADEKLFKQCLAQRIDSVITFVEPQTEFVSNANLNNVPVLFLNNPSDKNLNISYINIDNKTGSYLAANYMYNVHKTTKKYVYLSIDKVFDSKERYRLIKDNMTKLYKNQNLDFIYKDISEIDGQFISEAIKNEYFGIFAFNDEVAYKFLYLLAGIVPNARKVLPNLHIIGWDALSKYVLGLSDITSVSFNYENVINNAVRIIKKFKDNPQYKEAVTISTQLHIRVN